MSETVSFNVREDLSLFGKDGGRSFLSTSALYFTDDFPRVFIALPEDSSYN